MNRRFITLSIALCFALTLGAGFAAACEDGSKCDVERTCTKTEQGMTCTVIAKGETTAEDVRKCMRAHAGDHHKMEGVNVSFKDVEGGVQVVMVANTADAREALYAHGEGCCSKDAKGCCSKGATAKGCDHDKHAEHAKIAGCDHDKHAEHAKSEGCDHAKKAEEAKADAHEGCAKDCSKDCPHAKAASKDAKGGCSHSG